MNYNTVHAHRRRSGMPSAGGAVLAVVIALVAALTGTFSTAALARSLEDASAVRGQYTPFGLVDYDNDGHVDIVARHNTTGDLWLYPGQSKRGYSTEPRVRIGNGWNAYTPFGLVDYDNDGHVDIVARHNTTGDLWLYPGQSKRGYSTEPRVRIGNGWNAYTPFGLVDYDNDGHVDIVARHNTTGDLWLYPGQSKRGYSTEPRVRIGNGWNAYTPFGLVDYDNDGHVDIVARHNTTGDLWLYPGQSKRGYSTEPRVRIGNGWNAYTPFGLVDYDNDGHVDIVARHNTTGDLWLYPGQSKRGYSTEPRVRIGNGW